jgi:hypothetical protein
VSLDAGFRDVQRLFAAHAGADDGGDLLGDVGGLLELTAPATDPPRIAPASIIEGKGVRAYAVGIEGDIAFHAFLDGTQRSRVVHYVAGVPIVLGSVAAVVRVRLNRRLVTWRRPRFEERVFIPRRFVPAWVWERAMTGSRAVVDTTADVGATDAPMHPFDLLRRAVIGAQDLREELETELARDWCQMESGPLFLDGSVTRSDVVAGSECAVGVVKSHHTLYVEGDAMRTVFALPRGSRSSVLRIDAARRTPVATWYLRLRDWRQRDPMWGLVRVEAALPAPGSDPAVLSERADRISRWILAEAAPLALPDARWDKMVYGVRDCEQFLRAMTV